MRVIFRPIKDQDKQMEINIGMVITQIVDIDFEEKSLNLNVEFIMEWTDEFIKLNAGYGNKVSLFFLKHTFESYLIQRSGLQILMTFGHPIST